MKYIIIGLGNYGGGLAEELMAIGHEVIGVDQNEGLLCWMQRMNWLWKLCHSERSMW